MRAPELKHINRLLWIFYTEQAATMTAIKIILRITIHYTVCIQGSTFPNTLHNTAAGGGSGRDIGLISLLSHSAPSRTNNNQRSVHTTGYCRVRHKSFHQHGIILSGVPSCSLNDGELTIQFYPQSVRTLDEHNAMNDSNLLLFIIRHRYFMLDKFTFVL